MILIEGTYVNVNNIESISPVRIKSHEGKITFAFFTIKMASGHEIDINAFLFFTNEELLKIHGDMIEKFKEKVYNTLDGYRTSLIKKIK